MGKKILLALTIMAMIVSIIGIICTPIYWVVQAIFGFPGGDLEVGLLMGSWLTLLFCGVNLPGQLDPEAAPKSFSDFFPPF